PEVAILRAAGDAVAVLAAPGAAVGTAQLHGCMADFSHGVNVDWVLQIEGGLDVQHAHAGVAVHDVVEVEALDDVEHLHGVAGQMLGRNVRVLDPGDGLDVAGEAESHAKAAATQLHELPLLARVEHAGIGITASVGLEALLEGIAGGGEYLRRVGGQLGDKHNAGVALDLARELAGAGILAREADH